MSTNIIDTIYGRLPSMTPTDRKIAQAILDHPAAVVDDTIAQLAHQASVSEASVSRFCHNLDLVGFHQLKIKVAQVAPTPTSTPVAGDDNIQTVLTQISANKVAEVTHTLAQMPTTLINNVLNALQRASLVQIVAEGDTFPVAEDATYKLNQLGILAIATEPWETAVAQTMNLDHSAVMLAISNSGESRALLRNVDVATQRGMQVIAITNRDDSPLAQHATYHFTTAVRQRVLQSEYYFSRVAAMTTIEALYLLLINADEDRVHHIQQHEAIIADTKV